ncbi:adenosylcobinamide-GDP ribazoletransferase [Solibacillus sp. FSL K6-1523]|uniref:adenosylcobinamide-GDP ribazoletransferase n=1 Tax=Solibacillus sp. FSL K6-1523 TaxID=2921471 RepID=UPI0030F779F1
MNKLKNSTIGFLLAWQFFSAIPVKKSFEMNAKTVTWMYAFLPILGLLMGGIYATTAYGLFTYSDISPLLLAIILVVGMIVVTGGLHLDGWIDMSDAYFSYGDKEKRLAILDDPRTGAFGVISVMCLLLLKIGFVYEAIVQGNLAIIPFLLCIPFLARIGVLTVFLTTETSKQTGLAAYFKGIIIKKQLAISVVLLCVGYIVICIALADYHMVFLVVALLIGVFLYRKWIVKNFGGVSGDLLGAHCEGMEVFLWLVVLLFI